ncbi:DUF3048 domain-containing protein [Robertmurraya sp. DFI.2.37]|uniref:DUF3048 domain-containing protein n=1 Tax=Robertmurraya sp. DFI.2.37 TaxID=3031819 RepID=UPI001248D4DB|nr:DUF3048 domain-containing protein [Robertmurraya sp. DFI.2.37]MDF1509736.1 DUF3048 domain-containing protein [Robertmurraya sp. DFI.2.37]
MKSKWIFTTATVFFLLAGCSGNEEVVQEHQEKPINEQVNKDEFAYQYPLTGVGVKEESTSRAYGVMINNDPKARPQSGLHKADLVYELLAEGNVTRFLAIFQSEEAERIGPVRSARDYYIDLAKGYDALYVAHGYSPEARAMLSSGYIDNINGMQHDGTLFKRDSSRVAPHNSYITTEDILKGADDAGYNMEQAPSSLSFLSEDEVEALNGTKAHSVQVSYFSSDLFKVTYEYDEKTKKYERYSNGELTADLDSREPVLLDNILVIEADHKIIDDYGRREIDLASGGKAYLLQRGQWRELEWRNVAGRILPYDENGREVGFVPGKTWINVVPSDKGIENVVVFTEE